VGEEDQKRVEGEGDGRPERFDLVLVVDLEGGEGLRLRFRGVRGGDGRV